MFVWEKMKVAIDSFLSVLLIFLLVFSVSGCSKKAPEKSMILSQMDVDLLVQHKKNIDRITKKYDKILRKTKQQDRPAVVNKGKSEIDNFLRSKNLDPTFFMRKSKKILNGYIAFYKTSDAAVERRKKILKEQNLSEKEIRENIKAFKKEKESVFKELTDGLTDYEIELIRTNLKKIASVVKL